MSIRRLVITAGALACALQAPAGATTILVKFARPAAAALSASAAGDAAAGQMANRVSVVRLAPGESAAAGVAAYDAKPDVAYAEPVVAMHALDLAAPNDPSFDSSTQWGLFKTSALAAWALYPARTPPPAARRSRSSTRAFRPITQT